MTINKKTITIIILSLIAVLVSFILIYTIKNNTSTNPELSRRNEYSSIEDADITTINYLKELKLDVFANIVNGDIEYSVSISPKDTNNKIKELIASGFIKVPVKLESNGTVQTKILNLDINNFNKDKNGNISMKNIYHEDGVTLKEIRRKVDTLSNTIDFDYLYANYE